VVGIAQLLFGQLISLGIERVARLLRPRRGDELVFRRADGCLGGVGAALERLGLSRARASF
jgi:hypothetical protein